MILPHVVALVAQAREADPDYALTAEESAMLTRRVMQANGASGELVALLEAAVEGTPWVGKFGATASLGVGEATDPYVRMSRAECMLAALVLHVDGGEVNFVDEERVEVIRDGPSPEAVQAVIGACAGVDSS